MDSGVDRTGDPQCPYFFCSVSHLIFDETNFKVLEWGRSSFDRFRSFWTLSEPVEANPDVSGAVNARGACIDRCDIYRSI